MKVYEYKEGEKLDQVEFQKVSKLKPDDKDDEVNQEDRELLIEEQIKKEFLEEISQENKRRTNIGIPLSNQKAAIRKTQQSDVSDNFKQRTAPGSEVFRPSKSAYLKNMSKNRFFSNALRYQPYLQSEQPNGVSRKTASQTRIGLREHSAQKPDLMRPGTASASSLPGYRVTSGARPMSNTRSKKLLLLGTRSTFSKEFPGRNKPDVINKTNEYKTFKPNDFPIFPDDVLPTAEEGIDQISRIELLKIDAKNGYEIDKFIQLLKESKAAQANYEELRKTYYLHKARDEKLRIPDFIIPHSKALKIAKDLFPGKDYTGKHLEEFGQLYDSIHNFEEIPNITVQQLQEKLRDPLIDIEERNRLESLMMLVKHSRKIDPEQNHNLQKKIVQKEFERRQHDAILAVHYLKLKEFYKDRNYEAYANNLHKTQTVGLGKKSHSDEHQQKLKYARNAKQIVHSILDPSKFEGGKFAANLEQLEKMKNTNDYVPKPEIPISDEMEQLYPGTKDRFEKFKGKKYDQWRFDDELAKAKLYWNEEAKVGLTNNSQDYPRKNRQPIMQRNLKNRPLEPRLYSTISNQK